MWNTFSGRLFQDVISLDIKVHPRPLSGEGILAGELERLFTEEWGGPKSALAMAYLRDTVIPDLVNCLAVNWRFLNNPTFSKIIMSKLNSQFAYPPAFAEGLSRDILDCARRVLGRSPVPQDHPWQLWEMILRMFTIGIQLAEIASRTGFPVYYLEVFRKQYFKLQVVAENMSGATEEQFLSHRDLAGADINVILFLLDFRNRFTVIKNYHEQLQAEQIIMDLELDLEPDTLIGMFLGLFQVEKQVSQSRFVDILKGSKTAWLTGESYFTKTKGYGLLSDWPKKHITTLVESLLVANLLLNETGQETTLNLSEQAARLIVPLVVPGLADEVQSILKSKARDKISRSSAVIQGKNPEVAVHLIKELVNRRDTGVVVCFKALQRRVPKKVYLELLWACGELGGKDAVSLLSKTIQDRDSLVRAKTCEAMARMAEPAFYFALVAGLEDPEALVRENSALALGKLRMVSALKRIELIIANPAEEPQVQRTARETRAILLREKESRER